MRPQSLFFLLALLALGTVIASLGCASGTTSDLTPEVKEAKKQELLQIASIRNPADRAAALKNYLSNNPSGPHLEIASGLFLDSTASMDPVAALPLADQIISGHPGQDQSEVRSVAYKFKLRTLSKLGRHSTASSVARIILAQERDNIDLLHFASNFDLPNLALFEQRIGEAQLRRKQAEASSRYAELLELNPGEWEAKDPRQKATHVANLIESLESQSQTNQLSQRRLLELQILVVTLLNEARDGEGALSYLRKIGHPEGLEDWVFLARGRALESIGQLERARDAYRESFVRKTSREAWERLSLLSERLSDPISNQRSLILKSLEKKAAPFPDFRLKMPTGQQKSLLDFKNRAILVNFFFPG